MFRKSTSLKGKYTNLSLDDDSGPMIVQDVSMGGIGFEILGEILLEKEHDLEVTFTLDDKDSSFIRKLVVVKIVKGRYVGCEFKSSFGYDKALPFHIKHSQLFLSAGNVRMTLPEYFMNKTEIVVYCADMVA
jgi:hypothetical protein